MRLFATLNFFRTTPKNITRKYGFTYFWLIATLNLSIWSSFMIPFISAAIIISTTMPASPPPIAPSPKPPTTTQPSSPPTESWSDKMWRRYNENRK